MKKTITIAAMLLGCAMQTYAVNPNIHPEPSWLDSTIMDLGPEKGWPENSIKREPRGKYRIKRIEDKDTTGAVTAYSYTYTPEMLTCKRTDSKGEKTVSYSLKGDTTGNEIKIDRQGRVEEVTTRDLGGIYIRKDLVIEYDTLNHQTRQNTELTIESEPGVSQKVKENSITVSWNYDNDNINHISQGSAIGLEFYYGDEDNIFGIPPMPLDQWPWNWNVMAGKKLPRIIEIEEETKDPDYHRGCNHPAENYIILDWHTDEASKRVRCDMIYDSKIEGNRLPKKQRSITYYFE